MRSIIPLDSSSEFFPIVVDWDLAFERPETLRGLAYWRSLCAGRPMPSRRELKPRAMLSFLTYVNIVDVIPEPDGAFDYAVSLEGGHALEILGHMAGRRLAEFLPEPLQRRWRYCFDLPRVGAAPARITTRASTVRKNWLKCEELLAPLSGDDGRLQSVFWVFTSWHDEPALQRA
jgi:hypothetical protein